MPPRGEPDPLTLFHAAVREWFTEAFAAPTAPQTLGWPALTRGESTLVLAPTGSGKTLTAFLWALNQVMFTPAPARTRRCRILYISPLKALAVDVERNLREPLAGIARTAERRGDPFVTPTIALRSGDTPAADRARFRRQPADILITTPESLYLLLTSGARDALTAVTTVIVDEIHALVPNKRGAHLAVSLERLTHRCATPPQRIGLSATQRPLEEVARFLGGVESAPSARHPARGKTPTGRAAARPAGRAGQRHRAARIAAGSAADDLVAQVVDDGITQDGVDERTVRFRPVTVVDAGRRKALHLRIEVPVEDMARPALAVVPSPPTDSGRPAPAVPSGAATTGDTRPSIWAAIHPRVLELVRRHRSTLIFVNSRRLAERLAAALNELAGETIARSHHGSLARVQRLEVEDLLKSGRLAALVATSSLELGIDMGAIDLVVQIEAPPTVASGLQRIGRAGHRIDAVSEGVIFPKFRGDLLACAAVVRAMHEGAVEATRYPRNPLDVAAQHIVAMTAMDTWQVDDLFATVRGAAPFAGLGRTAFEGLLDMLSGRYPSDEFAELRPRVTWDRVGGTVTARDGAKRVAIANGGTIPDRGLYGVYLVGAGPAAARVGELDEEMVFESHPGETFVLGASSWRIDEITHDRVLVSPAPGVPGKMPFWKGDRAGRPLELGLAIGHLTRTLTRLPPAAAIERLSSRHDLDARAAEHLLQYLADQQAASGVIPDASTIVVERVRDDLGDWRVCVLSPRGGRVHAPWAMAAAARIREQTGIDVETLWGDDGFVVRFPDVDTPPDPRLVLPDPDEVHGLVVGQLGATALFAAKFRENAARSLLLPKRRPGTRAPLWQQRKRAADLLAVASRFASFPVLLETYRECLRDVFDMPALVSTLRDVRSRSVKVVTVDSATPSPFAASLLFSYVASFLYDGDAPLAERRAQALAVDQAQLRELIGDAELRDLLDADAASALGRQLQRLDTQYRAKSADGVHDLLLALGDLDRAEIAARTVSAEVARSIRELVQQRRAVLVHIAGAERFIAVEDAARYRDGLGVRLPPGLPETLLATVPDAMAGLALRFARTHTPFTAADVATRFGVALAAAEGVLLRLTADGRLLEGEFNPGGTRREWTDAGVLRQLRRRSLARLRREVEPVEPAALGRLITRWQGVVMKRRGADALLDIVEQLQGCPLPASLLETDILPARLDNYDPGDLDAVLAAGEVVWIGIEPIGEHDGRLALFLADHVRRLLPPRTEPTRDTDPHQQAMLAWLNTHGASFFQPLHEGIGGGYPAESLQALWSLVWNGRVTSDAIHALRAYTRTRPPNRRGRGARAEFGAFRSRRHAPPTAAGRWSLAPIALTPPTRAGRLASRDAGEHTRWLTAAAHQLLARYGVLTRDTVGGEPIPGGFGVVYPILKALEESGKARRGYFVAGLGATQFAAPGAIDLLRSVRDPEQEPNVVVLSAVDPANPYGATVRWPAAAPDCGRGPTRTIGATVVLVDGALVAFLARGERLLVTWLPDAEPDRSRAARAIAHVLIARAHTGADAPRGMLIESIDGSTPATHVMAPFLIESGFVAGALGFHASRPAQL